MQKLKLQNTWNNATKSFDKNSFELKESDKTFTGKVLISSKENDKWISKPLPFIAFKSKIDEETQRALKNSKGELFNADFDLTVASFDDKETGKKVVYHRLIITKASFEGKIVDKHNADKANGYVSNNSDLFMDDEIPF